MSLHDISKSQRRLNPQPNTVDALAQRMAHNTTATSYKTEGAGEQRIAFKNGMILTYDSDNKISSVFGYVPGVSDVPILVVAKDGYDLFEDIFGIDPPAV